jgi:hypothetical protein
MRPFYTLLAQAAPRKRISINDNWRFAKGDPTNTTVSLLKAATATTEAVRN